LSPELITGLLFGSLILFLVLGLPLVFVLGGVAVVFTYFLWGHEALYMVATRTFTSATSYVLLAIPMFIFMGNMLLKSGIADDLYRMMYHWLGRLRGGLAMGTVGVCTIFAAMVGVSGAATVTMGLIALPSMLKRNYDKSIAVGCIAAGGALGILIPPSVLMIALALFANISVGRLFAGGVFSGLLLSFLFCIYIGVRSLWQPRLCPPVPPEERLPLRKKFALLRSVILPILLVTAVMGSIFAGAATPTEASGVGALGSIICALVYRRLTWQNLRETCYSTLQLSCMVMWIIFAASCFTALYTATDAPQLAEALLMAVPGGRWGTIVATQVIFLILGMLLDPLGIMMICTPIFFPIVVSLGFDPVWFGVLFVINMEMGFLTPPFGFNLFYLKAIVPKDITMGDIYRSIIPFVILQGFGLVLCMIFPQIILWLPNLVLGY